jgi:hypothetical protein
MLWQQIRLQELEDLKTFLEQGEDKQFFDLLFPKPEKGDSHKHMPAIEALLVSGARRKLFVEYARMADDKYVAKIRGVLYENSNDLKRELDMLYRKHGGFATKKGLAIANARNTLNQLRTDMAEAQQAAATMPPPALVEAEAEAA